METCSGEWTGAVLFAKSNIEARKKAANEFNDGELGGLRITRAPWADEYGSRAKIPVSEMIHHGWHFECCWSGATINEDTYYEGLELYNYETKEYYWDETLKGQKPVGFQEGLVFACQEYADEYYEYKRKEKEYHEEQYEYYKAILLKRLPDAVIIDEDRFGSRMHISSRDMKTSHFEGLGHRYTYQVHIAFDFPGRKYWAALEYRQPESYKQGPTEPEFACASGDLEVFEKFAKDQKEKYKL